MLRLLRNGTDLPTGNYWTEDGVELLSPTREMVNDANERDTYDGWNHLSQVLRIVHGKSSVILAADTSVEAQEELVSLFGENLSSTILKAPHHGRKSGYCADFVKYVAPDYTIVSVGAKPDTDATRNYAYYTHKGVFTTRKQGTIHAKLWPDGTVKVYNHRNERLDVQDQRAAAYAMSRVW